MQQERKIDQELRSRLIEAYIEKENTREVRKDKKILSISFYIVFALFYLLLAFSAFMAYKAGYTEDIWRLFAYIFAVQTLVIALIYLLMRWLVHRSEKDASKRLKQDLENTSYIIEEEFLAKEYESDKRKNRKFYYDSMCNLFQDERILTADYGKETLTILDFYDPPIYEELKQKIESSQA